MPAHRPPLRREVIIGSKALRNEGGQSLSQQPKRRITDIRVIITRPHFGGTADQPLPWKYLVVNNVMDNVIQQGFIGGEKLKREDDVQAARRLLSEQSGMSVLVEDLEAVGTIGNTRYFHLAETTPRMEIESWPTELTRTQFISLYEWHTRIHDNTYPGAHKWRVQDKQALDILLQKVAPCDAKVSSISTHTLPRCVSTVQHGRKRCQSRSLFDSGASHSVMDTRTAEILGIKPDPRRGPRSLIVANGKKAPIMGMTDWISVDIGGVVPMLVIVTSVVSMLHLLCLGRLTVW